MKATRLLSAVAALILAAGPLTAVAQTGSTSFLFALDDGSSFAGTLADGLTFDESVVGLHLPTGGVGTNFELWPDDAVFPLSSIDGVSFDGGTGTFYLTHTTTSVVTPAAFGGVTVLDGDILSLSVTSVDGTTGQINGGTVTVVTPEAAIFSSTGEDIDALHRLANGNFLISTSSAAVLFGGTAIDATDVVEITPAGAFVGFIVDGSNDSDGIAGNEIPGISGSIDAIDDIFGASLVFSASGAISAARSQNGIAIDDGETFTLVPVVGDVPINPYVFDFDMDGLLLGGAAVGQGVGNTNLDDLDGLDQLTDLERLALIDALGGAGTPIADALIAIPEPGTLALLGVASLGLLRRRKRKSV